MHEQSKAAKRRIRDPDFMSRYFVGYGLDVGAGEDGLGRWKFAFPLMRRVDHYDKSDGDAQTLGTIGDNQYDFLHASHILEHVNNTFTAMLNWIRVVRPGGYLIITLPDFQMYERGQWPSRFSWEHKHRFSMFAKESEITSLLSFAAVWGDRANTERLMEIREFYDETVSPDTDQTLLTNVECAIEWVLKKL